VDNDGTAKLVYERDSEFGNESGEIIKVNDRQIERGTFKKWREKQQSGFSEIC
jgi:hypothetical protein